MAEQTEVLPPPASISSCSREKKVEGSGRKRDSIIQKCSSFSAESPNSTKKKLFSKYKTDPYIEVKLERKPICTKEEIEKKRKEALAKKRLSQSQNKKWYVTFHCIYKNFIFFQTIFIGFIPKFFL